MKKNVFPVLCAILALVLSNLACGASSGTPVEQWASSASASSEFGTSSWTAEQATGEPDTADCGDRSTAWASWGTTTVEWLQLNYTTPVYATEVVIYMTYNPSYVVLVELIDTDGNLHSVYNAAPETKPCPYEMSVSFPQTDYLVTGVVITIDQSTLGSWNEIDAVQLIGAGK